MSQKMLGVILTLAGPAEVEGPVETTGWGDDGCEVFIGGPVADIRVTREGQRQFSLRILGDGTLILTSYSGSHETSVPQNLRLTPTRPWEAAEAAGGEG